MNDLEITRLCAEAMGLRFDIRLPEPRTAGVKRIENEIRDAKIEAYNPLHDDAQAMALVKRFGLAIQSESEAKLWGVHFPGPAHEHQTFGENLNRAICECVAKMQASK